MGDEMKQAETGMPSLTLEPDFAPEVKKEPEVQVQGQLMEVASEMDPVQQKMAQTVLTPEEQKMVDVNIRHDATAVGIIFQII